jgi:hypothetical protein
MSRGWVIEVRLANRQAVYWTGAQHRAAFNAQIDAALAYPSAAAAYERALWLLDTRPREVQRAEVKPAA